MMLIDAEALIYWLDKEQAQEQMRNSTIDPEELDLPRAACILATISKIKSYVKAMPTYEPPEKVVAEIKGIEEETVSRIIKDLLAEHEAAKEHEHDYFLASISESYYCDRSRERSYRYATLVCRKCGETKEIKVEDCSMRK